MSRPGGWCSGLAARLSFAVVPSRHPQLPSGYSFLLGGCRCKRSIFLIEKNNLPVSQVNNQVSPSVVIHIFKTQRDRGQFLPFPDERWANVDFALTRIISWFLNHHNLTVQVLGDKMTVGVVGGSMPNVCVYLVGAGSAILPVFHGGTPPITKDGEPIPPNNHKQHDKPYPKKPVKTGHTSVFLPGYFFGFARVCSCWRQFVHTRILYGYLGAWLA